MTPEEQRVWLAYEAGYAPDPEVWCALLFLVLELWNSLAWEVRQALLSRAVPVPRPFQRYQPGRHHLAADVKPLPEPDPMDEVHTAYLRAMAERMAHRYEIWS